MSGIMLANTNAAADDAEQVFLAASYSFLATDPGGTASASLRLNSSGIVQQILSPGGTTTEDTWLLLGVNSDYESRMTTVTGSLTSGTVGTWQALSSSRTWTLTTSNDDAQYEGTLEIRRVSDSEVLATSAITLIANSAPA